MTPKQVSQTVFNDKLIENIAYLWSRWQDEQGYEDFKDYEQAMLNHLKAALPDDDVSLVRGTQEPWGIIFRLGEQNYHMKLHVDMKKQTCWLSTESV